MSVKADLATTNVDAHNTRFSKEALKQIAEQAIGMRIGLGFDSNRLPIGVIVGTELKEDRIEIEAHLKDALEQTVLAFAKEDMPMPESYIVTGYKVEECHYEGDIQVIDKATLLETAMTTQPTDKTQRPIFWISYHDIKDENEPI